MLRMDKKTSKIQLYHIRDKAENNQRIKRNEENVCVCLYGVWCMVSTCVYVCMLCGVWLVHLNH
jgi:hypothetical protein